jgi:hypothetical protein
MEIVIHPYFKDQVLSGNKRAIMVQTQVKAGEVLTLSSAEDLKEVPFANCIAREAVALKIVPKRGQIYRWVNLLNVWQWLKCQPETVKRIILVEGFNHPDDFWNNQQQRAPFQVWQVYFDTTRIIK